MKIYDPDKLRTEITQMLHYKWTSSLNYHILPLLIDDVLMFLERYENKPKV